MGERPGQVATARYREPATVGQQGVSIRVNVGCGASPTRGWVNLDNSVTIRARQWPLVRTAVLRARIAPPDVRDFLRVAAATDIRFANAARRLPCGDGVVDVIYSSHMVEHLDRNEARAFLREVRRVLRPGGLVRLAVPDLARLVRDYVASGDADTFVAGTHMWLARPAGVSGRLRSALVGPRNHLWMYDGQSLSKLVAEAGFLQAEVMPPGRTRIADPGGLDLAERAEESVYVEAVQPS